MNEEKRQNYLKEYFTEYGIKALENRLQNIVELYVKKPNYPFVAQMLGFSPIKVHSLKHHQGMIDNMVQLLGKDKIKIEVKNGN